MIKRLLSFLLMSCLFFIFSGCGEDSTSPNTDPTITTLSKNHGEIGSIIDINGKNFAAVQGSGYVEFTGARASASDIMLWSDVKITVKVPTNAKTGKLLVNANGKNSNQVDFTVDAVASSDPYIESLNPSSFTVGNELEINGRNFGALRMTSYVEFARGARPQETDYTLWTDNKIKVTVPTSITSAGKLFVGIKIDSIWKKSNDVDYIIIGLPYITDVSPDTVHQGEELTINGSGFGGTRGTSYVNFGGYQGSEYSAWSDGLIKVKVPLNVTLDTIEVRKADGKRSNKYYIKILPPEMPAPIINNISPNPATNGKNITITGEYFGSTMSNSNVKINGIICTDYTSWTNTQIIAKVHANATSGSVIVTVINKESNAYNLTVQPPAPDDPYIDYIDAQSANEGQSIGINGSYFGATRDNSYVEFNGTNADTTDYVNWSDTRIVVRVPVGATSGLVRIHVGSKISNGVNLNIQSQNYIVETVLIPSGTFIMGKDSSDEDSPKHQVTISNTFYMGKYEVSQLEWKTVMDGSEPSSNKDSLNPVEQVDWYRVLEFCNRLSVIVGLDTCYIINGITVTCNWNANGFRLPTEAEWEYAARAGTQGNWAGNIDEIGWTSTNSGNAVHNVGTKNPNDFGLYDMHGNILEWCWDWYDPDYYKTRPSPDVDPRGPSGDVPEKVVRGGSFRDTPADCASPKRDGRNPVYFDNNLGFRVVRKK